MNVLNLVPWQDLYLIVVAILLIISFYLIFDGVFRKNILKQKKSFRRSLTGITSDLKGDEWKSKYNSARKLMLVAILAACIYIAFSDLKKALIYGAVAVFLFILASPKETFFKWKSPYKRISDAFKKRRQQNLKRELITVTIQLKNLVISEGNKALSLNYILTRLLPYTGSSKPYFTQFLSLHMKGQGEAAAKSFEENFGFKLAGDFVYILLRLDTIPAREFLVQLDSLLGAFNEERETMLVRESVYAENLLFTLASLEVVALLINFVILIMVNTLGALVI